MKFRLFFVSQPIDPGFRELRFWTPRIHKRKVSNISQLFFIGHFVEHIFVKFWENRRLCPFFGFSRFKVLIPLQIVKTQRFCRALVLCFILIYWLRLNFFGSSKLRIIRKAENTYFWSKSSFFPTFPTSGRMLLYDVYMMFIWCYMMLYDVIWCYMMLYDVIQHYIMLYDVILWCMGWFATKKGNKSNFPGAPCLGVKHLWK